MMILLLKITISEKKCLPPVHQPVISMLPISMESMTKYEILYIIRPNIDEEAKTALVERFDAILTENGAANLESKDWEKRKLAYEINDFREGIYHIATFEAETTSEALSEFDRLAKINLDILRHMIVKVEA